MPRFSGEGSHGHSVGDRHPKIEKVNEAFSANFNYTIVD